MRLRTLFATVVLVAIPLAAHADGPPNANIAAVVPQSEANDPAVARLLEAKSTIKWNYTGKEGRYGHAETLVEAPVEKVASTVVEFGKYRELHRKFSTARVIAKEGANTDVYMRYPVQIGPMKIEFYEVMRFQPLRVEGDVRVLEAHGIKGDMSKGHTLIRIKPVGPKHSLLTVDILLVPKIPAPQSMIDEELRDGAHDFVDGLRHRAQGWSGHIQSL